jgi:hypothetical protein
MPTVVALIVTIADARYVGDAAMGMHLPPLHHIFLVRNCTEVATQMLIIPFVIIPAKAIAKTMTRKVKTSGACRSSANQLPIVTRTQKGETEQEKRWPSSELLNFT